MPKIAYIEMSIADKHARITILEIEFAERSKNDEFFYRTDRAEAIRNEIAYLEGLL